MDQPAPSEEKYHLVHLKNSSFPRVFGVVFVRKICARTPEEAISVARDTVAKMQGIEAERLTFSYLGQASLELPDDVLGLGHFVEFAPGHSPKRPSVIVII